MFRLGLLLALCALCAVPATAQLFRPEGQVVNSASYLFVSSLSFPPAAQYWFKPFVDTYENGTVETSPSKLCIWANGTLYGLPCVAISSNILSSKYKTSLPNVDQSSNMVTLAIQAFNANWRLFMNSSVNAARTPKIQLWLVEQFQNPNYTTHPISAVYYADAWSYNKANLRELLIVGPASPLTAGATYVLSFRHVYGMLLNSAGTPVNTYTQCVGGFNGADICNGRSSVNVLLRTPTSASYDLAYYAFTYLTGTLTSTETALNGVKYIRIRDGFTSNTATRVLSNNQTRYGLTESFNDTQDADLFLVETGSGASITNAVTSTSVTRLVSTIFSRSPVNNFGSSPEITLIANMYVGQYATGDTSARITVETDGDLSAVALAQNSYSAFSQGYGLSFLMDKVGQGQETVYSLLNSFRNTTLAIATGFGGQLLKYQTARRLSTNVGSFINLVADPSTGYYQLVVSLVNYNGTTTTYSGTQLDGYSPEGGENGGGGGATPSSPSPPGSGGRSLVAQLHPLSNASHHSRSILTTGNRWPSQGCAYGSTNYTHSVSFMLGHDGSGRYYQVGDLMLTGAANGDGYDAYTTYDGYINPQLGVRVVTAFCYADFVSTNPEHPCYAPALDPLNYNSPTYYAATPTGNEEDCPNMDGWEDQPDSSFEGCNLFYCLGQNEIYDLTPDLYNMECEVTEFLLDECGDLANVRYYEPCLEEWKPLPNTGYCAADFECYYCYGTPSPSPTPAPGTTTTTSSTSSSTASTSSTSTSTSTMAPAMSGSTTTSTTEMCDVRGINCDGTTTTTSSGTAQMGASTTVTSTSGSTTGGNTTTTGSTSSTSGNTTSSGSTGFIGGIFGGSTTTTTTTTTTTMSFETPTPTPTPTIGGTENNDFSRVCAERDINCAQNSNAREVAATPSKVKPYYIKAAGLP